MREGTSFSPQKYNELKKKMHKDPSVKKHKKKMANIENLIKN